MPLNYVPRVGDIVRIKRSAIAACSKVRRAIIRLGTDTGLVVSKRTGGLSMVVRLHGAKRGVRVFNDEVVLVSRTEKSGLNKRGGRVVELDPKPGQVWLKITTRRIWRRYVLRVSGEEVRYRIAENGKVKRDYTTTIGHWQRWARMATLEIEPLD